MIDLSFWLNNEMNILNTIEHLNTPSKTEQYSDMQYSFYKVITTLVKHSDILRCLKHIEEVQHIQMKIIEKKKENLRHYNRGLNHRKRSHNSGYKSLGTSNNNNNTSMGESRARDKSFTTN